MTAANSLSFLKMAQNKKLNQLCLNPVQISKYIFPLLIGSTLKNPILLLTLL